MNAFPFVKQPQVIIVSHRIRFFFGIVSTDSLTYSSFVADAYGNSELAQVLSRMHYTYFIIRMVSQEIIDFFDGSVQSRELERIVFSRRSYQIFLANNISKPSD